MVVSLCPLLLTFSSKTNALGLAAESAFEAAPVLQEDELVQSGELLDTGCNLLDIRRLTINL
jgi:hypothetical protein